MKAATFRSRWNRRRARQFGLGGTFMAPIERFFLATTVSGFLGLFGSIVWLMVSPMTGFFRDGLLRHWARGHR